MSQVRLIFVDSDQKILDGHRRLLKALRPSWNAIYASDGRDAMAMLLEFKPDVLVTELNILTASGDEILKAAQKLMPEVIRIVLSSEPDAQSETVLRATQSAHRFLAKPCKGEMMLEHIEKATQLRKLLNSAELREIIGAIPALPSLPQIYHELVSALESPQMSVADIGEIIARDVSMTGRILHLVNSAFFGLPRKISNPQEAAVLLGINVLKSLVLYVKLFFAAPDSTFPGLALDDIWAHSSKTARLSRDIGRDLGLTGRNLEDAFLAGMMHDFGKLLLLDQSLYLHRVSTVMNEEPELSFAEAEYKRFSTSHAEIGAYLLGLWGLPDVVVEAVACHHRLDRLAAPPSDVLVATYLANYLLISASGGHIAIDETLLKNQDIKKLLPVWQNQARKIQDERES